VKSLQENEWEGAANKRNRDNTRTFGNPATFRGKTTGQSESEVSETAESEVSSDEDEEEDDGANILHFGTQKQTCTKRNVKWNELCHLHLRQKGFRIL
jgi:hypothetical protein